MKIMVKTRAFERTKLMGSWVEIGVNNTSLLEENVVEDTSNGAIEVVNMNQEFLSQLLGTRKSMEENLELRR